MSDKYKKLSRMSRVIERSTEIMKKTKEQPIWKPYPDYPFVEANQFGEIRTVDRIVKGKDGKKYHVKGRVLKQHDNGKGYMQVRLSVNGNKITLKVHRIVATCFLPNPDNLPEVNHIDCDPTNNAVSNLEWCTQEYNIAYREKYGTALNRPVIAVNLETFKILRFESRNEAARQLGVNRGNIYDVINGRQKTAGGYLFVENESEITEEKIKEIKTNMRFSGDIIAVNLETFTVLRFESQAKAELQLGVCHENINKVIKGKRHKTGGYWFTYADENAVKKTRMKFGDDIANKVEKLMNEHRN